MVNTPVLFETFARPDYARQAFDAIKKAKPRVLFFYSNKARPDRPDEVKRNEEIRSYIKEIDWDCDLHTFFREDYVDVFTSLWGSLDWFFNNVEEGIILEEDCVASLAFFDYCDKLLPLYRKEKKIMLISGDNFTPEYNSKEQYDYFFTRYMHIYGWCTWRDRWKSMDRTMRDWEVVKKNGIKCYYKHDLPVWFYKVMLNKVYHNKKSYLSWDYITLYNMIKDDKYAIMPSSNLVDNIGDIGANSTVFSKLKVLDKYDKSEYPTHYYPSKICAIDSYDYRHFKKHIFWNLVKYEIKKAIHQVFHK